MPAKAYPTDVLEQAQAVLDAWKEIGEKVTFGDLTQRHAFRRPYAGAPASISNELPRSPVDRPAQPTRRAV